MRIERSSIADLDDWTRMREALWPSEGLERHRQECMRMLAQPQACVAFLARVDSTSAGFAEASLRRDHVNGCETSPVGFLEGIYVEPGWRRCGVARALVEAVRRWTLVQGCSELASDVLLDNELSQQMHNALGFEETERVVYFRQVLRR
ncbi:aminoglycoside N(6')-acetyltransferase type 1 [Labrys miyagiensis]